MALKLGTFNLNNLFSRFDFTADVDTADAQPSVESTTTFSFSNPSGFVLRRFQGRLVRGKPAAERAKLAARIAAMDVDVLAVQEVEDVNVLRQFNREDLGGRYAHVTLIEGNDPRLIDVGVLSKLPLGAVTSWQHVPDPASPGDPLFSRDLLEVEILRGGERLLTLFVNHLKSHFVPFTEDPATQTPKDDAKRQRQAEGVARIVAQRTRPDARYVVLGDMNDPPDSPYLAPFTQSQELRLGNGLAEAKETRAAPDADAPARPWTHRFKPRGAPAQYELLDQIWLSPALGGMLREAWIDRRTRDAGDGSDHDPAWVVLDL